MFGIRSNFGTDQMSGVLGVLMAIFGNVPQVAVCLSIPDYHVESLKKA